MQPRQILILVPLIALLGIGAPSSAQPAYTFSQQGFLTKSGGQPVDSTLSMTFKLYKGGVEVWSETHPSVQVTGGAYEVPLGSLTPFDTVAFGVPIDLGIKVGADPEMNPKQPLRATPQAMTLQDFRVRRVQGEFGSTVNIIGGHFSNSLNSSVEGGIIAGGGSLGESNMVLSDFGVVIGGRNNTASLYATVAGGHNNTSFGSYGVISGGHNNEATTIYATVGGGSGNVASGTQSTVGGGGSNTAEADRSTVGGGRSNQASGDYSTIGGGQSNQATGNHTVVSGGHGNDATALYASVGGGNANSATATAATIAGGVENRATGVYAFVGAGLQNQATGSVSSILGGELNAARGSHSFAGGYNTKARHIGSFAWGDWTGAIADSLVTTGSNQFLIRAGGGVGIGTNSPDGRLHVAGTSIGVSSGDVERDDIVIEDADAILGLYSDNEGTWASGIVMGELDDLGILVDKWAIVRETSGSGSDLHFRFGTGQDYVNATTNFAITDLGNVYVTGDLDVGDMLTKGGGTFKIDHPLDPENKYLYHSFVESPDMKNVYDGNVILGESGSATVSLPDYFEALNRDFRYQLTCIGGYAPVYVAEKISGNAFRIAGGEPGMEISWMVTGIRNDPFAEMNRVEVEVDKEGDEIGTLLHPEAYGHGPARARPRPELGREASSH